MTREFFERHYIQAGKNLRQLEAETGIPRRFLTRVAREHGITMAGVSGPAGSRSRYRDRMPINQGPGAAAARQAASLFRILANPTRLAILLTLQDGEQRIVDLTAQLGGPQANISAHLTRLKQSGRSPAGRKAAPSTTASPSPNSAPSCTPPGSCSPPPGSRPPRKMTNRRENPAAKTVRNRAGPQLTTASGAIQPENLQRWIKIRNEKGANRI